MDMKVSEAWLRTRANLDITSEELTRQLTAAGLTIDRLEPVAPPFTKVVVGRIDEVRPHPSVKKLSVCTLYDGEQSHTVVCGAPNVRAGTCGAFARVGALLPGDMRIEERTIGGVESSGMLCAEDELGLGSDHDGILVFPADAPVGEDLRVFLQLADHSVQFDLTPNRADCLSVEGLARELTALNTVELPALECPPVMPTIEDTLAVKLDWPTACPKYLGRVIRGVDLTRKSPLWMRERLRRSGIRSIDPVVDVTNYVLRELGQPMHAFDLDKLTTGIQVRSTTPGERLTLLNGQEVELHEDSLLIADGAGPIALAGVMGGLKTSIQVQGDAATTNIFLECAYFDPITIIGKARSYGLATDAAQCYERGVDFELQERAIERATALLLAIVGGDAGPVTTAVAEAYLPKRPEINLRLANIKRLLGIELPPEQVVAILRRLNFAVKPSEGQSDAFEVKAPGYRFDIDCEAALITELARFHGYDKIPYEHPVFTTALAAPASQSGAPASQSGKEDILVTLGYQEAITYAFIGHDAHERVTPDVQPVLLQNPSISDRPVMRASLLPGLLSVLTYNWNRQQRRIHLFESGRVFEHDKSAENAVRQTDKIAVLRTGTKEPEGWSHQKEFSDFYDLKGDFELVFGNKADSITWTGVSHPALHPGQSAQLILEGGQVFGIFGRLHPQLEATLGIRSPVYVFEVDRELESKTPPPVSVESLSAFPSVRRDIAILVDQNVPADQLLKCAREAATSLLVELVLFDLYEGSEIESGKKSIALGFTFQDSTGNLLESTVEQVMARVLEALSNDCTAVLRG